MRHVSPIPFVPTKALRPPTRPARTEARDGALDGLRALAALGVVVLHVSLYTERAKPPWDLGDGALHALRLGLVLFFVLSGYLLVRPWLAAAAGAAPRPRLGAYVLRRAARVLPAYYVALLGAALVLWGTGSARLAESEDIPLLVLMLQNWSPTAAGTLNPPAWTLCVEASFYALLPLLGFLLVRLRARIGRQLAFCGALVALSVAFNVWVNRAGMPGQLHSTLPGCLYAFACGMGAAVLASRFAPGRAARWALIAGGLALAAADALLHLPLRAPGLALWQDLPAAVGFAAVLAGMAGAPPGMLASAPLRWIGVRSYGLYLWHFPVILLFTTREQLPETMLPALAICLSLSLTLAALSWRLLERPAQEWARRLTRSGSASTPAPGPGQVLSPAARALTRPLS
jgi:peptidoglycan/LPS O-acetylase OafA/YrhL